MTFEDTVKCLNDKGFTVHYLKQLRQPSTGWAAAIARTDDVTYGVGRGDTPEAALERCLSFAAEATVGEGEDLFA